MPTFPRPTFPFEYEVDEEIAALRAHRAARGIPGKHAQELMVGTWNIANLGAQQRTSKDFALIAEILGGFDVIAVQECRSNTQDLLQIVHAMGEGWGYVMSDAAGNDERMVFIFDRRKLSLLEEIGEIAFPPSQLKHVKLVSAPKEKFIAFDRNPYLASFQLGERMSVQLVNVHLFYGDEKPAALRRRAIETAAVARWCDVRRKSKYSGAREIIALGDFNMSKAKRDGGNIVYEALTEKELILPGHSSEIGSSIASDNHYDQIAIYKSTAEGFAVQTGIFDYDKVIFKGLWQARSEAQFNAWLRYYISDHRPMWMRLKRNT